MRVLVIPSWYPDGEDKLMGIYHKEYAHALSKYDVDVDMLVVFRERLKKPFKFLFEKKNSVYKEDGYNVYLTRTLDLEKVNIDMHMNIYYKKLERLFKKYVKKNGMPDVLHAEVTYPAGYAVCKLGKKYNIPVLVQEHASGFMQYFSGKYEKFGKYVLDNSKFSTVSNLMKKELGREDTLILPNIVDTAVFDKEKVKRDDKNLNLITVSAFRKGKGVEFLCDLFAALL